MKCVAINPEVINAEQITADMIKGEVSPPGQSKWSEGRVTLTTDRGSWSLYEGDWVEVHVDHPRCWTAKDFYYAYRPTE